ncbi:MAG: cupredoxin domain-containing protein, partial [Actinomycetota bacterium]
IIVLLSVLPLAASGTSTQPRMKPGPFAALGAPEVSLDNLPDPLGRATAWLPQAPGTKKTIELEYGPYVVHPGSDLTRVDAEIAGASGFATGFEPSVVLPDGTEASSQVVHIHHAHWFWLDPDAPGQHRWFYGTGEEETQGSINPASEADPRHQDGLRYGIRLEQGDRLSFLSMLHNKTAQPLTLWIKVRIEFVYGTGDAIKEAKGLDYRHLTPVLVGATFQVPRTDGIYAWPRDFAKNDESPYGLYANPVDSDKLIRGVGHVWKVPWDGTIVIGAGHSHPGAKEVVLSNLGTKDDPCPDEGDGFAGTTLARSTNFTRNGVFPSEEFQMGLTQPGWRVHVRKGDRLSINGVYDSSRYAYRDAMSFFGFYADTSEKTSAREACKVELVDRPNASHDEIVRTTLNRKWSHHPHPTCTKCDDTSAPRPEPGPSTNVIHIAGHTYFPGNLGFEGPMLGPPVVERGETLRVVNEDYAGAAVRHSVTSCRAPCNGEYVANYPFHDGQFDSGALGYMWEDGYVANHDEPYWEFDTSELKPGYYTYYCRLHAWMRGSFYVE